LCLAGYPFEQVSVLCRRFGSKAGTVAGLTPGAVCQSRMAEELTIDALVRQVRLRRAQAPRSAGVPVIRGVCPRPFPSPPGGGMLVDIRRDDFAGRNTSLLFFCELRGG